MNQTILCLTDSNFSDHVLNPIYIKNNQLFLIDFWAEWCNPCKMMTPVLEELATDFNHKIKVAKINVDDNPITTKNYNIKSIPTLLLIRKGVILSSAIGLSSKQKLKEFIKTYL